MYMLFYHHKSFLCHIGGVTIIISIHFFVQVGCSQSAMEDSESDASVDDDAEEIVSDHSMKTSVAVNDEDITVQDSEQELLSASCGIFLPPKVSNLLDSNVDDVDDILNCVYINEDGISAVDPVDESEVNPLALEGEKDPLNDEEEGQDNTLRNIKVILSLKKKF